MQWERQSCEAPKPSNLSTLSHINGGYKNNVGSVKLALCHYSDLLVFQGIDMYGQLAGNHTLTPLLMYTFQEVKLLYCEVDQ